MRYYFDSHHRIWVRRLLIMSDCKIDLTICGDDWETIKKERLRVHDTTGNSPMVDDLPSEVYEAILENLGEELGTRLLTFNYIGHYGVRNILVGCNYHAVL